MYKTSKSRYTGSTVVLTTEEVTWGAALVMCATHDTCCEFETIKDAKVAMAYPDNFCGDCYNAAQAKSAVNA